MREFFKGWRRKVGCVLLVMAVLFVFVWLRSLVVEDRIFFHSGPPYEKYVMSTNGRIWLAGNPQSDELLGREPFWGIERDPKQWADKVIHINATWQGFSYVNAESQFYAVIPYWSLVLPLTLLSAYLILWKPRKKSSPI